MMDFTMIKNTMMKAIFNNGYGKYDDECHMFLLKYMTKHDGCINFDIIWYDPEEINYYNDIIGQLENHCMDDDNNIGISIIYVYDKNEIKKYFTCNKVKYEKAIDIIYGMEYSMDGSKYRPYYSKTTSISPVKDRSFRHRRDV